MTNALYNRIEAIESFAADVAHELKNPLTSLRSAVETLPLARTEEAKARLAAIIQHDVRRLDRLISDISNASRLDAELARQDAAPVDIRQVLETVVNMVRDTTPPGGPKFQLDIQRAEPEDYFVLGHDIRLGQVFNNLIDNARSFCRKDGTVRVRLKPTEGRRRRGERRGRWAGHPRRPVRAHLRALLHRPVRSGDPSARIRASAFRSASRSSRRTAARSSPRTARGRHPTPASRRRWSARASPCGCPPNDDCTETVHASAVLVGEHGVLIRGASGSGKSSLVLGLIDRDPSSTRLIADDRVHLDADRGRLVAAAPDTIAGKLEVRGQGIVEVAHVVAGRDRPRRRPASAGQVSAPARSGRHGGRNSRRHRCRG